MALNNTSDDNKKCPRCGNKSHPGRSCPAGGGGGAAEEEQQDSAREADDPDGAGRATPAVIITTSSFGLPPHKNINTTSNKTPYQPGTKEPNVDEKRANNIDGPAGEEESDLDKKPAKNTNNQADKKRPSPTPFNTKPKPFDSD